MISEVLAFVLFCFVSLPSTYYPLVQAVPLLPLPPQETAPYTPTSPHPPAAPPPPSPPTRDNDTTPPTPRYPVHNVYLIRQIDSRPGPLEPLALRKQASGLGEAEYSPAEGLDEGSAFGGAPWLLWDGGRGDGEVEEGGEGGGG